MTLSDCRKIVEKGKNISKLLSKIMATLNPVIVPAKVLKGGKHKIRISVAHNGETRYILTDIIIDSEKEFKNGQVVKRPDAEAKNTRLRSLLQKYHEIIYSLNYINCFTCSELISQISNHEETKNRTISSVFDEYIKYSNLKKGTILAYNTNFNTLVQFLGHDYLVQRINHKTIMSYNKFLESKKYSNNTIINKMAVLWVIVGYAKRCQYAEFKISPFDGYELPEKNVREAWLSIEDLKRIRDLKTSKKNIEKCRDIFMLSYYLGGINICDLLKIDLDKSKTTIKYTRSKTDKLHKINKYVEFKTPDEAKPLIEKFKRLKVGPKDYKKFHHLFFYYMPRLAEATGIKKKLIYYSARKSFQQHAFEAGIQTCIIEYILNHKIDTGSTSLFNYIVITPEIATEAVRKVLDRLKQIVYLQHQECGYIILIFGLTL